MPLDAVIKSGYPGLVLLKLKKFPDERGVVLPIYNTVEAEKFRVPEMTFRNLAAAFCNPGAVKGSHVAMNVAKVIVPFPWDEGQAMAVILVPKQDSKWSGCQFRFVLRAGSALIIPRGLGNGLQARTTFKYFYAMTDGFSAEMESESISYQDIAWPYPITHVSVRDQEYPRWQDKYGTPMPNKVIDVFP